MANTGILTTSGPDTVRTYYITTVPGDIDGSLNVTLPVNVIGNTGSGAGVKLVQEVSRINTSMWIAVAPPFVDGCSGIGYAVDDTLEYSLQNGLIIESSPSGPIDTGVFTLTGDNVGADCGAPVLCGSADVVSVQTGTANDGGILETLVPGWYTAITVSQSGQGTGLTLDVYIDDSVTAGSFQIVDWVITNTGSGYVEDEIVTIVPSIGTWDAPSGNSGTVTVVGDTCNEATDGPTTPVVPPVIVSECEGGVLDEHGMITFVDRRGLRDGIRNCNLDYNFRVLATGSTSSNNDLTAYNVTQDVAIAANAAAIAAVPDLIPLPNVWTGDNSFDNGATGHGIHLYKTGFAATGSGSVYMAGMNLRLDAEGVGGQVVFDSPLTAGQGLYAFGLSLFFGAASFGAGISLTGGVGSFATTCTFDVASIHADGISMTGGTGTFDGATTFNGLVYASAGLQSKGAGLNSFRAGINAAATNQGQAGVAIGQNSGRTNQGANSIAIGTNAGNSGQLQANVAIGASAGQTDQQSLALAIGLNCGKIFQGSRSVAIGTGAGTTNQGERGIIINSGSSTVDDTTGGHIHIKSSLGSIDYTAALGWTITDGITTGRLFPLEVLQTETANATDFADFQARIAAL